MAIVIFYNPPLPHYQQLITMDTGQKKTPISLGFHLNDYHERHTTNTYSKRYSHEENILI